MVKQQQKKDKEGGSVELGAVATPVVLYGLRSLLTPNKKDKKETAGGKQRKQRGGEGLADLGKLVQKSMEGTVTGSLLNAVPMEGGKRRRARKQRGGEDMPEMPNPSVEVPEMPMEGGKRRKQRKQRGGEGEDMSEMPEVAAPEVMEGGKRRRTRKQRGGEGEDMPEVAAPEVMEGGKRRRARKQRGGEYAPVDDLKADIGIPKQDGGKKQKDQKKYWAKKGGALDQYAKQLEKISNQLSKLMQ
jgi:hypothetical protein